MVTVGLAFAAGWIARTWWRKHRLAAVQRREFTRVTEQAARIKLNENVLREHPDVKALDELDRRWYI